MTCRFIEEYANFRIKQLKKDLEYKPEFKGEIYGLIENAERTVKLIRQGIVTVDEGMIALTKCDLYYCEW